MSDKYHLAATDPLTRHVGRHADALLRWIVGLALVPHGVDKLLHIDAVAVEFADQFHLRPGMAWGVAIAIYQIVAGLLICFDIKTRWVALSVPLFMLGTMLLVTMDHGWFWHRGGVEYSVIWSLLAILVAARAKP